MAQTQTERPTAFVIMPFGNGFDQIYNQFLREALTQAGFDVTRADDIMNAQNIIKDIVRRISESDLIVADLTDSNPNVYYELGLAHGLNKPVILLIQEIKEIPFDLRSYRVISYTTHFSDINDARKQLSDLAAGILTGTTEFGSPASDFLESPPKSLLFERLEATPETGEPGLLDHMAGMEEGFEQLGESLEAVGTQTEELSGTTIAVTSRLEKLKNSPSRTTAREMRNQISAFAQSLGNYASFLDNENKRYAEKLERTRTALEFIVRAQNPRNSEEIEELKSLLSTLDTVLESAQVSMDNVISMIETLRETPPIERSFNRARERSVNQLQRLTANIEQTLSMISRVKQISQSKLEASFGESS